MSPCLAALQVFLAALVAAALPGMDLHLFTLVLNLSNSRTRS